MTVTPGHDRATRRTNIVLPPSVRELLIAEATRDDVTISEVVRRGVLLHAEASTVLRAGGRVILVDEHGKGRDVHLLVTP